MEAITSDLLKSSSCGRKILVIKFNFDQISRESVRIAMRDQGGILSVFIYLVMR